MKFLADMGISHVTVTFLRSMGYDALHLAEQRLFHLPDSEIIKKAQHEERIILTVDLDFGELMAFGRWQLPSIIILRLQDMRPNHVNSHLKAVLDMHKYALEAGAILSIQEKKVRIRQLPIL